MVLHGDEEDELALVLRLVLHDPDDLVKGSFVADIPSQLVSSCK